jgi:fatty acid synthase subunit alpha
MVRMPILIPTMLYADTCRIDTQDVLLGQQQAARVIEVGPSDTLTVMAKRTIASKYESHDKAKSIRRELLCSERQGSEIYYDNESVPPGSTDLAGDKETNPVSSLPAPPTKTKVVSNSSDMPQSSDISRNSGNYTTSVPDAAILAKDVVISIIAQKLRKTVRDIAHSSTIKHLVGGWFSSSCFFFDQSTNGRNF